jgi:hypothetical protein
MTTINSDFNFEAFANALSFVKVENTINTKVYTLSIVLHSPTEVIEKKVYAESDEEAIFDASQMAKDWKEHDHYYHNAYLSNGTSIIKKF